MPDKPFTPEEFKTIYSKVPRLCVDAIVVTETGIPLLLRKHDVWNNLWHFPGVTVFYKETLEQAVKRAAKSEAGLEVLPMKPLGFMEFKSEENDRGFGWTVSIPFLCRFVSGELTVDEDSSDIKFFTQMPKNMIPEQKEYLEKYYSEIFSLQKNPQ